MDMYVEYQYETINGLPVYYGGDMYDSEDPEEYDHVESCPNEEDCSISNVGSSVDKCMSEQDSVSNVDVASIGDLMVGIQSLIFSGGLCFVLWPDCPPGRRLLMSIVHSCSGDSDGCVYSMYMWDRRMSPQRDQEMSPGGV